VFTLAAVVACGLLAVLAIFQLCLVLGMPWGRFAWGGSWLATSASGSP
jgi:hypothetical protein